MDAKYFKFSVVEAATPTNMVSNGTFDDDTDWSVTGSVSITGGQAILTLDDLLIQAGADMLTNFQNSTNYRITFDCVAGGYLNVYDDGQLVDYLDGFQEVVAGPNSFDFTTPFDIESLGGGLSFKNIAASPLVIDNVVLILL